MDSFRKLWAAIGQGLQRALRQLISSAIWCELTRTGRIFMRTRAQRKPKSRDLI